MESEANIRPVEFTPRALTDLSNIIQWTTLHWSTEQSKEYEENLFASLQHLAQHVRIGRADRRLGQGIRVWVVEEHTVVYVLIDEHPRVLRIVHHRQRLHRNEIGDGT